METMAERIKFLRESADLTKTDLAKQLGVSRVAITKYENGSSRPVRRLEKLAAILKTTTDYLLTGRKEGEPLPAALEELQLLPEEWQLLRQYRQLDERGKNVINSMLAAELRALAKPVPSVATGTVATTALEHTFRRAAAS